MGIGRFVIGVIITALLFRTGILNETTGPVFALVSIAFILLVAIYAWIISG
jgi:TM2 domain-containing membrane protein YozV